MNYPPKLKAPYQLLPWMTLDDFQALKASIKASGRVEQPLFYDELGNLLDGHHRDYAVEQLESEGIKIKLPDAIIVSGLSEEEKDVAQPDLITPIRRFGFGQKVWRVAQTMSAVRRFRYE